jgi:hypothetical protein
MTKEELRTLYGLLHKFSQLLADTDTSNKEKKLMYVYTVQAMVDREKSKITEDYYVYKEKDLC